MEKAILKTLIYADLFDYPMKAYEIHKWLIGKTATLRQIETALFRLKDKGKIGSKKGYYFLPGRSSLVAKRKIREKLSGKFFRKAKLIAWFLKLVPWIKLIGISGGLAMANAGKADDIDLFIITAKNRLWLSRMLMIFCLNSMGVRRKVNMKTSQVAGKLCLNILLEEDRLDQRKADIYLAHEVLQMKVLWQRRGVYQKYLMDNEWVFKFLPNWVGNSKNELGTMNHEFRKKRKNHGSLFMLRDSILAATENLAKWFQLMVMNAPKGMERIEEGALYFHPQDCRPTVLEKYRSRIKNFSTT